MLSEFEKQILRANQLIIRDRQWNEGEIEEEAKITDRNISELLNPKVDPTLAEETHDAMKPEVVMNPDLFDKGKITKKDVPLGREV